MKPSATVRRCGVHKYAPTWYAAIGTCTCVHTLCVVHDDGYHEHRILIGDSAWPRIRVIDHLHAWTADTDHPEGYVSVERGSDYQHVGSDLADAWHCLASDVGLSAELPEVPCRATRATPTLTAVSGPWPPSSSVRRCDVGAETLTAGASWWLVAATGRGWPADHGTSCADHLPPSPAVSTSKAASGTTPA